MNSNQELEVGVLGDIRKTRALLEAVELERSDFTPGIFRQAFIETVSLFKDQRPEEIDPLILRQRLGGNGSGTFVASLMSPRVQAGSEIFRARSPP